MSDYRNEAHRRFERMLKRLDENAARRNRVVHLIDSIDLDETPDPSMADFRKLRKIFISKNAEKQMNKILHDLSMVGRDDEDDPFAFYTTRHSLEFYAIYNKAIRKCNKLYGERKYEECMDHFIGLLFGLKDYDTGFVDTESVRTAQGILRRTATLFADLMTKRASTVGIDEAAKEILYEVAHEIQAQYADYEYRFDVGEYRPPRGVVDDDDKDDFDDDEEDEDEDVDDYDENHNDNRNRNRNRSDSDRGQKRSLREVSGSSSPRQRKRRRLGLDDEDDVVEAYSAQRLRGLKVTELKELLRAQMFPVSGNKAELIQRLMYPEATIVEMKRSEHNKRSSGVWCHESTPQHEVNRMIEERKRNFDPNQYVWKDGKVRIKF